MQNDGHKRELDHDGWLFLHPRAIPQRWRARAVEVAFIPLLPHETLELLETDRTGQEITAEERPLVNLLASGASAREIGRRLQIAERTVYRRIARLRSVFQVETTHELVALLSRRGFG